jgi:hypothetical protein
MPFLAEAVIQLIAHDNSSQKFAENPQNNFKYEIMLVNLSCRIISVARPQGGNSTRSIEADLADSFTICAKRFPPFGGQLDLTSVGEFPIIHCGLKGEKLENI